MTHLNWNRARGQRAIRRRGWDSVYAPGVGQLPLAIMFSGAGLEHEEPRAPQIDEPPGCQCQRSAPCFVCQA